MLFPLAAFVIVGLVGRRLPEGGGHVVVGAMAGSFVLSLYVFIQVLQQGALGGPFTPRTIEGYGWIPSLPPEDSIKISLLIDHLSALSLVLVSVLRVRGGPGQDGEPLSESLHAAALDPDPAAPVRRGRRQERAVPVARVAPRRDGRPDDGQRPDPRGDDGQGRRLPDRPRVHLPRSSVVGRPASLHRHPRHRRNRRIHDPVRRAIGPRGLPPPTGPWPLVQLSAPLH